MRDRINTEQIKHYIFALRYLLRFFDVLDHSRYQVMLDQTRLVRLMHANYKKESSKAIKHLYTTYVEVFLSTNDNIAIREIPIGESFFNARRAFTEVPDNHCPSVAGLKRAFGGSLS